MWLRFALLLSPLIPQDPYAPSLPAGARVLLTVDGNGHDHLGMGLLDLGDVDGDHVPDFLVGASCGVPGLTQGRGYALLCSGKDGHPLRRFDARDEEGGVAYAGSPTSLGDLDGDGVSEIALAGDPSLAAPIAGYVDILSPKSSVSLHVFGGTTDFSDRAWVEGAKSVGDLDADGALEIAVWTVRGRTSLSSKPWAERRLDLRGRPIGSTPDLNGDGVRDVLCISEHDLDAGRSRTTCEGILYSGKDGKLLQSWLCPENPSGRLYWNMEFCDLDQDGVPDVAVVAYVSLSSGGRVPAREAAFDCTIVSGRSGKPIHAWREELDSPGQLTELAGLADLDGDRVPEFVISRTSEWAKPRSSVRIFSGKTRTLLCELSSSNWSFGSCVRPMSDLDGDGRPELLVSEHEYGGCAGRAWVISLGKQAGRPPK